MDTTSIPPAANIEGRIARTTVTSFRVLEAMVGHDAVGVSELAEELSLGKGTVHKHLNTLRELGYVVKTDDRYRLGLRFLELGADVRARTDLYEVSHGLLQKLASATGEVVSVMVPEGGHGVYLTRITDGEDQLSALTEGERVPLTATAGGKAILAYLPSERREAILDEHGLPTLTENTITDSAVLREELQDIHDRRIAYDRGELELDRHCVAAPITDDNGVAIGAVTVSGPADRMREKSTNSDFPSLISSTADGIENRARQ